MPQYDNIPDELKNLAQWVCTFEGSKVPMKAFENEAASSTNPATWTDFNTALGAVEEGFYDYYGFVFAENGLVGILRRKSVLSSPPILWSERTARSE